MSANTFNNLTKFFDQENWNVEIDLAKNQIWTAGQTTAATFPILVKSRDDHSDVSIFLYMPFAVPERDRFSICELITRANYGLVLGNFEMDMNDGELRFRLAVPTDRSDLTQEQFRRCLMAGLYTVDRFYPAFQGLLFGRLTPQGAMALACQPATSRMEPADAEGEKPEGGEPGPMDVN